MPAKEFISWIAYFQLKDDAQFRANSEDEIIDLDTPEEIAGIFNYMNSTRQK